MKQYYEEAKMKMFEFAQEDVILTSNQTTDQDVENDNCIVGPDVWERG